MIPTIVNAVQDPIVEAVKGKKSWYCDEADKSAKFCMVIRFGVKKQKIIGCNDNSLVGVN